MNRAALVLVVLAAVTLACGTEIQAAPTEPTAIVTATEAQIYPPTLTATPTISANTSTGCGVLYWRGENDGELIGRVAKCP